MALIAFAGGATRMLQRSILHMQSVCGGDGSVLLLLNVCLQIQMKTSFQVDLRNKLFPSLDCLARQAPR